MGAVEEVKEKVEALKAKISELKGSRADKATVMPLVVSTIIHESLPLD